MLERARRRRQELLERGDPDEQFAEFRDRLDEVEATERAALEALAEEAATSGDERRREVTDDVVAERSRRARPHARTASPDRVDAHAALRVRLERGPRDLRAAARRAARADARLVLRGACESAEPSPTPSSWPGCARGWTRSAGCSSSASAARTSTPRSSSSWRSSATCSARRRLPRRAPREPGRSGWPRPQAMFDSLSADQRAELERLGQSLFEDMDLNFAMSRLAANLSRAFPEFDWARAATASRATAPSRSPTRPTRPPSSATSSASRSSCSSDNPAAALPEVDLDAVAPQPRRGRRAVARPAEPARAGAVRRRAHRAPRRAHSS